jgi:hypothetical protein
MKKLACLVVLISLYTACKKDHPVAPTPGSGIQGKWAFVSVTTVFRDSVGNVLGGMVYPNPPDAYYQFNKDGSWGSKFVSDGTDDINNQGFYRSVSDTSFVIYNTGQNAYSEDCKIYSLTSSQFIFSHRRNTKFNGVTPGSEEYIFKLSR